MEELFLPVLHSFENNNVFTGSYGALRFKVTPAITMKNPKEVDMEASCSASSGTDRSATKKARWRRRKPFL